MSHQVDILIQISWGYVTMPEYVNMIWFGMAFEIEPPNILIDGFHEQNVYEIHWKNQPEWCLWFDTTNNMGPEILGGYRDCGIDTRWCPVFFAKLGLTYLQEITLGFIVDIYWMGWKGGI